LSLAVPHIIALIAISQAAFLIVYILSKKRLQSQNNIVFILILFIFIVLVLTNLANSYKIYVHFISYHKIIFILRQLSLIIPPLLFIYAQNVFSPGYFKFGKHFFHFLPFLFVVAYYIVKLIPLDNFIIALSPFRISSGTIILAQNLIYLVWIGFIINKYKKNSNLKDKSSISRKNWLRLMLIAFIVLWLVQFNSFIVMDLYRKYKLCPYTSSLYFGSVFIIINVILYNAVDISDVFKQNIKYVYSKLSPKQIDKIYSNIEMLMNKERLYNNPDLTLSSLSTIISVPQKYLSQVINEKTNHSFNDFINSYRIKESKKLLKESHKNRLTISEILYEVGFNTRSSFYKCFKENTGITPTEYRKKYIL